ncbi:MAG TPA: 3-hydroxyacyl-CoA dehydrogenase NAD-binding domain-containing protein [Roseiarcus sp.]|nr:3-hydroxyacyl-CoA dehydrogenase NAD-binding domain-containing protein [Roseiarcus sp.]
MSEIKYVAVLGPGIIGSSFALVFARAGVNVRVWERREKKTALERIETLVRNLEATGLEGDGRTLQRVSVFSSIAETVEGADYLQEAVVENLEVKKRLFEDVERYALASAILASSTSGLLPSQMAGDLAHPERFLVAHPLTPPHLLPAVEVCPSPRTSPEVVTATMDLMKRVGQRPILIRKEIVGFALNRVLGAIMNEFFALIDDGVLEADDVDAALTEGFGLRWSAIGPLAAMDLNAPGGIRDYLGRYGSVFNEVARSRGATPALKEDIIDKISAAVERLYARQGRAARAAHRDRAIAEIRRRRSGLSKPRGKTS